MNYTEIINLALSYSDRTDSDITERMGDFVKVVEARINRALRVNQMSTRSIVVTLKDQQYIGLPKDFAGIRDIEVKEKGAIKGVTAHYLNPEQMNSTVVANGPGSIYYTIVSNQIQLFPAQDDKLLEIVYYRLLDHLDIDNDTNWLSLRYPDSYVFGLIVEIESFVKNPAGAEMWNQRFESALVEIAQEDQIDRWSGTPLTVKVG